MQANNTLVKSDEKLTFSRYMSDDKVKNAIAGTIGKENQQRFAAAIISAVSTNPALQECENKSILSAAFLGEALKLSPSPQLGQYYLVPFNDKKKGCKVAQFQLGYKGYIQLAIRSGYYKKINVVSIKNGELIKYDPLSEDIEVNLIEDDEQREQTETIGYYAMFEYQNGFKKTLYWSKKKMLSHADKYSAAFNKDSYEKLIKGEIPSSELWKYSSFWYKDFDGMAYKTMLRQLISKWGIMSIDMQEAYDKDMATINEDGTFTFIENEPIIEPQEPIVDEHVKTVDEVPQIEIKEDGTQGESIVDEFFN